ncbi:MAG TPA: carboxypeptidase-like regulatory domain-containing protein [Candidatus Aquilonibacter sp.]|nr:carboxypeptidase-like regulatory domain-containing protein [Candidatus Aquilonibacter sp.]
MRFLRLRYVAFSLLLALVVGISVGTAHAADVNGRIKGTVTDPSGAVIPGASVIATNIATGVKYTTKTLASGDYLFPQLPVGTYSISVSSPNFKSFTATGIILTIDKEYVENAKLEVGNTSETLEVAADAVQVNTTDMQLNNVVTGTQMTELPLIGRNFTGLELIEPGVQASSDRFGTFSVSGSQTQQSEYLINGADSNDIALNTLAISPNLDAIDQFNLIEGPLNAEYDRDSGGIVSATIIQGTNHFHGDAFEFYRDTFLNTNNFFQKSVTGAYVPVTPYHQNIFGGTIGGPVFRDKLFFFGAYQGIHQRVPDNTSNALPSTLNRSGNFSDIAGPALSAAPVVTPNGCENSTADNPLPGTPDWGEFSGCDLVPQTILPQLTKCSSGMYWSQCAYAYNGNFPTTTFNPIAAKLLSQYVPTPNSGTYGYVFNSTTRTSSNQYIGRLDYSLNPANQFYGVGIFFKSNVSDTIPFTGATLPGFGDQDLETIQQYTFDYVHQFGSTAVNDFAIHWTRFNYQAVEPQGTVSPSSLGFSINPQDTAAENVPTISVGGNNTSFTLGFSTNGPQPRIDQVYQLDDNITKTIGHHTLKFGYDGRRFNVSNPFYANNSGDYNFDSNSGSSGNNSNFSSGDGTVDFLLGVPGGYSQGSGATIQADAFLNYIFAQDAWKVTNTLTFNYGLGYSIDTPLHNNQYAGEGIVCLNPGEQSKVFPTAPLGITYPGDAGCTNSGKAYTRFSEFGPRIGFAWAPDLGRISGSPGKFSIRGGFGIYYDRTEEESSLQTLESTPFGITSSGATTIGVPQFANPFADVNNGYGANCYPGGTDPSTGGPCVQGQTSVSNPFPYVFPVKGQAVDPSAWNPIYYLSTYDSTFRAPYAENIQLSVEREFPSRIVARLTYVGSMAHHNQITYEGNPTTAAGHAACAAGNEYSPVLGASVNCVTNANYEALYWPNNTAYGSIYAPTGYPGFTGIGEVGSESSSNYNGLQASVTKATTHGLTFQLSYTFSHALDNGSSFENSGFGGSVRGYNQYDQALNYGNSAYDARQRLVFSPVYISPILHGHSTFSPINLALSGWELSGITTLATGFPYDISYGGAGSRSLWCSYYTVFYACPDVPEQTAPLVRGSNVRLRNSAGRTTWFQGSSSFVAEPIGTFGNISRNPFHGPGINNTNLVVAKNFNLSADGVRRLQLRMESDNAFNHTQFSNPGGVYGASTFGLITGAASSRQTQLAAKFYF